MWIYYNRDFLIFISNNAHLTNNTYVHLTRMINISKTHFIYMYKKYINSINQDIYVFYI